MKQPWNESLWWIGCKRVWQIALGLYVIYSLNQVHDQAIVNALYAVFLFAAYWGID